MTTSLIENTAAKLKLIDDYAFQGVTRGIVACFGQPTKEALIIEMVEDGLLAKRCGGTCYGVQFYELTADGWAWLAERRCFP